MFIFIKNRNEFHAQWAKSDKEDGGRIIGYFMDTWKSTVKRDLTTTVKNNRRDNSVLHQSNPNLATRSIRGFQLIID